MWFTKPLLYAELEFEVATLGYMLVDATKYSKSLRWYESGNQKADQSLGETLPGNPGEHARHFWTVQRPQSEMRSFPERR
jgi:hypothetical protein